MVFKNWEDCQISEHLGGKETQFVPLGKDFIENLERFTYQYLNRIKFLPSISHKNLLLIRLVDPTHQRKIFLGYLFQGL